ncbi:carboxylesterase/lipase family protein [Sphingomonas hengshuiensis]|uniref:carboxylesterase/lipase family protein n=1 Tax=Sphingomonas hengshuiensis TaxID=1609977 RepID=UPI000698CBCB|nr:carboxylesterase family protein [Sphingomonas hengshuiensis]
MSPNAILRGVCHWMALTVATASIAWASSAAAQSPVVAVTGGAIAGHATDGATEFLAIPYAAPPVGTLRWRAPAPVLPWAGQRDASRSGPACLQNDEGWNHAQWLDASEDCLTLDVRTPSMTGKRPVVVWIHGGSNRAGSGRDAVNSGFVGKGLVVVSIQYRLGVLGFLSHPALAAEQGGASGNYGLMDQIAALRWVRDNIARFGGDPAQVTIMGESAGAQDVSLLLAAPDARGLFRAAVLQSGTPGFGMSFRSHADAMKIGEALDRLAGAQGDLTRLRRLSPVALFALQSQLSETESHGSDFVFLRTTIDGRVLPESPDRLLAKRPAVPVIIGTNTVEFGPGAGSVPLDAFAQYWFGAGATAALGAYRDEEARGADPRRGNVELRMQSDAQFHCPANRMAALLTARGWPVWRYEFDVGPTGGLTSHAAEIGYIFGGRPVGGGVSVLDYWSALALHGDPNAAIDSTPTRPAWPSLAQGSERTLRFGGQSTEVAKGLPRAAFCSFASNL